jgi:hypothetical protein
MTVKRIRSSVATGCLLTMLALPAVAVVGPSPSTPDSDQGVLTFWDPPSETASLVKPPDSTEAWSLNTFVLMRADVAHPLGLNDGAPSTEQPAKVQPATPAVARPGTVQNLHRADGL